MTSPDVLRGLPPEKVNLSNEQFETLVKWAKDGLRESKIKLRITLGAQDFPIKLNFYDDAVDSSAPMGSLFLEKQHLESKEAFLKQVRKSIWPRLRD